jgi:hypothetical protein
MIYKERQSYDGRGGGGGVPNIDKHQIEKDRSILYMKEIVLPKINNIAFLGSDFLSYS